MRLGVVVTIALAVAACSSAPDAPSDPNNQSQPTQKDKPQAPDAGPTPRDDAGGDSCATVAPNHRCGLAPQCGCLTNETCDVTIAETGATSCVAAGSATLGRPCKATGDCLVGLTCLYGACRPYCTTARSPCATAGTELCVEHLDANNKPAPNMDVCTITCDPRNPSAVCGTNTCIWFPTYYAPAKVSDCNFPGTKTLMQACTDDFDCGVGLACVTDPTKGKVCERW